MDLEDFVPHESDFFTGSIKRRKNYSHCVSELNPSSTISEVYMVGGTQIIYTILNYLHLLNLLMLITPFVLHKMKLEANLLIST